ncbi:MAG TPA: response regulator [Acidobacteriaceae bacterium]
MPPQLPTRVLLIDDDEMSRDLLSVLLEAEGCIVSAAESGDAALALLQSTPSPALILTDMQMPGSTPGQLAGRLRRACGRSTLLLAMSGSRPSAAVLARYDGFLLKPFGAAEIMALLQRASEAPKKIAKTARPISVSQRIAVLDSLAASAEQPASNLRMNAAPVSSTPPAPLSHSGDAPVLDEAIYSQLALSMPAPQLKEMYAMCVDDARVRIASMRALAAAHDPVQFMRQAHTIKGSCGMLGAAELHRLATTLEQDGPGLAGSAVNSLDELSNACDRLERMLGARA